MADSARLMLEYMTKGIRASILGTLKVYHMDKVQQEQTESSQHASQEPMSTLARRRAERMKPREKKTQT